MRYQIWTNRGRHVGEAETVQGVANIIMSQPRLVDDYYFSVDSNKDMAYRVTKYTWDVIGLRGDSFKTLAHMRAS